MVTFNTTPQKNGRTKISFPFKKKNIRKKIITIEAHELESPKKNKNPLDRLKITGPFDIRLYPKYRELFKTTTIPTQSILQTRGFKDQQIEKLKQSCIHLQEFIIKTSNIEASNLIAVGSIVYGISLKKSVDGKNKEFSLQNSDIDLRFHNNNLYNALSNHPTIILKRSFCNKENQVRYSKPPFFLTENIIRNLLKSNLSAFIQKSDHQTHELNSNNLKKLLTGLLNILMSFPKEIKASILVASRTQEDTHIYRSHTILTLFSTNNGKETDKCNKIRRCLVLGDTDKIQLDFN